MEDNQFIKNKGVVYVLCRLALDFMKGMEIALKIMSLEETWNIIFQRFSNSMK